MGPLICSFGGYKVVTHFTLDMTFYWLGEMFEGDIADMHTEKFPLESMGA